MKQIHVARGVLADQQYEWFTENMVGGFGTVYTPQEFYHKLRNGDTRNLVVEGENSCLWEISPYLFLANQYGWKMTVVTFAESPIAARNRDSSVPLGVLVDRAYRIRNSPIPESWGIEEIQVYRPEHGWFRPVGVAAAEAPDESSILESVTRELARTHPNINRLREIVSNQFKGVCA